jgi:predicted 3-demethylubiquinone-9 3-methyltransferase (glyoxalase superfamily)
LREQSADLHLSLDRIPAFRQPRPGERVRLVQDKWGLSWQITPVALIKAITDPDPAAAKLGTSLGLDVESAAGSL